MRLKCLGCDALARLVYQCAAWSPHIVDVELFQLGLHSQPPDLRERLQRRVDAAAGQGYDAILLAYGLCGQATAGLTARDTPLVIPRAHDCITLFIGDRTRYQDQFTRNPGTYWYALDYVERRDSDGMTLSLGASTEDDMPTVYADYVERFGKDNADYLMEVMGAWKNHYQRAVFIDMGVGDGAAVEAQTRGEAARRGWSFDKMGGDIGLIRRLLTGDWGTDFLVLQPGECVTMTYGSDIIAAQQSETEGS